MMAIGSHAQCFWGGGGGGGETDKPTPGCCYMEPPGKDLAAAFRLAKSYCCWGQCSCAGSLYVKKFDVRTCRH